MMHVALDSMHHGSLEKASGKQKRRVLTPVSAISLYLGTVLGLVFGFSNVEPLTSEPRQG